MVQIPVCHILAVQLWASDLTSLSFDLFIGKVRAIYSEPDKRGGFIYVGQLSTGPDTELALFLNHSESHKTWIPV